MNPRHHGWIIYLFYKASLCSQPWPLTAVELSVKSWKEKETEENLASKQVKSVEITGKERRRWAIRNIYRQRKDPVTTKYQGLGNICMLENWRKKMDVIKKKKKERLKKWKDSSGVSRDQEKSLKSETHWLLLAFDSRDKSSSKP